MIKNYTGSKNLKQKKGKNNSKKIRKKSREGEKEKNLENL